MDERLKLGWRGFEQAEQQLREEIHNNEDPLVPLGNLMQWAYALEQWYETRILDGKKEIEQVSTIDTVGETYNGFQAARNRVAHDLLLVADLVTAPRPHILQARGGGRRGGSVIIAGATHIEEWLWIQTPDISHRDKGLPFYRKHLAGKPITTCLPAVREFLDVRLPNLLAHKPKRP
jgi:hypothetical protein